MGVKGLSTFVDDNRHIFLKDHQLHDVKVVIDGSNLFHFLYYHYKICYQYGGDYDHFARKCKRFFHILKECNVTPFVVFDGGYDPDDRKLPTVLERMNDRRRRVELICFKGRGCVLPILSYETFREVLVELEIAHVSCMYEADREIAVLAKKWKCPVMSNDSDFFIYRLEGGFIPLDYINLTLCVFNTDNEEASVLEGNSIIRENEYVYIPVKYYNCAWLLKLFKKEDDFVLPLVGTLLGNDYVNYEVLYSFYQSLHAPKNPSKKAFHVKASNKVEAVLNWIEKHDSEEEALELLVDTVTKERKDSFREVIEKSIMEYKDIDQFASADLELILTSVSSDKSSCQDMESDMDKSKEGISELSDYFGRNVPPWFLTKLRRCELNGSFLQNACVNRRIIFNCQVEALREISSYACSRNLRSFVYGLIFGASECNGSEKQSRNSCIEEYDRQGKDTKKFYVKPVCELPLPRDLEFPSLDTIPSLSRKDRKKVLYAVFGITSETLDETIGEMSELFILTLSFWIKNVEPKVMESHLNALIICVIALHLKQIEWLSMKKEQGCSPYQPKLYEDIVQACNAMPEKQINFFKRNTYKHFSRPHHSAKTPRDNKVLHGYAQFQACFLDTLYLNQVLQTPVDMPSPSAVLNCTFLYNLCRDLESRYHADLYCMELLGRGSALYSLFLLWKKLVISLCKENPVVFDGDKKSAGKTQKKKSKSKGKVANKKESKRSETNEAKCTLPDEETGLSLAVNCDVSNKFALLGLDDS